MYNDYTSNFNDLDIKYEGIEDDVNLYFNGGYCTSGWWEKPNQGIICILNSSKPRLSYSDQFGRFYKTCRVMDVTSAQSNTIQDKICQAETGKTANYSGGSNYYAY